MIKKLLSRFFRKALPYVAPQSEAKFRLNSNNVAAMRALLTMPFFQDALRVLYDQIPRSFPAQGEPISDSQAAVELGRVRGYMECLENLHSLATYPPASLPDLEADYGADKIMMEMNRLAEQQEK
jgi:hypothetical protein